MRDFFGIKLNPYKSTSKYVTVTGLMLALAAILTALESRFSAFLPVGVRIGLSNVVIMTAITAVNIPTALIITVLKSVFVLVTRGVSAGFMSFSGGVFAFAVASVLFKKTKSSYILISVLSAVAHTIGQLLAASMITQSVYTLYYSPLMITLSIVSGFCTGIILNTTIIQTKRFLR